jgi:hypothetical protein
MSEEMSQAEEDAKLTAEEYAQELYDTAWCNKCGVSPCASIDLYGPLLFIHILGGFISIGFPYSCKAKHRGYGGKPKGLLTCSAFPSWHEKVLLLKY